MQVLQESDLALRLRTVARARPDDLDGHGLARAAVQRPHHHAEGEPLEQNWIARQGADNFTRLIDYTDAYAPGARRFDMGERNNFINMPMAVASLEQLAAWTPAAIQETLRGLLRRARNHVLGPGSFGPVTAVAKPHHPL